MMQSNWPTHLCLAPLFGRFPNSGPIREWKPPNKGIYHLPRAKERQAKMTNTVPNSIMPTPAKFPEIAPVDAEL